MKNTREALTAQGLITALSERLSRLQAAREEKLGELRVIDYSIMVTQNQIQQTEMRARERGVPITR